MKTLTVNKGERFGRLVVIKEVEPRQCKKGKVKSIWRTDYETDR